MECYWSSNCFRLYRYLSIEHGKTTSFPPKYVRKIPLDRENKICYILKAVKCDQHIVGPKKCVWTSNPSIYQSIQDFQGFPIKFVFSAPSRSKQCVKIISSEQSKNIRVLITNPNLIILSPSSAEQHRGRNRMLSGESTVT